ncbi:hypothetical protein Cph01nite_34090 [Cellulomonas phragmiteti]|uniref:eCIS core domain-containing protein n=1 Tax=Cellulomonas phragmiteti TaxID=478780 RepID=A0ABQ4DRM2_9CELL|nr:hypothetical protein Cph01nite_34090 [Cellulomonas phragmiteti]
MGTTAPRALPPIDLADVDAARARTGASDWRRLVQGIAALSGLGGVGRVLGAGAGDVHPVRAAAERVGDGWGLLGAGSAVPGDVRRPYEQSFGSDLSAARMHVGSPAARAVTSGFGVEAMTVDHHMLFAGTPSPRVLGHELAHVAQHAQRTAPPTNTSLRAARPGSDVERDADAAAAAALSGRPHAPRVAGGEDVSMLAPLAILAIAALVAGGGVAVAAEVYGPSYEENQRRAAERSADPSLGAWAEAAWLWVPVGGTASRIWEAQSPVERYLNVAMMPLDVLTLGALGSAAMKISSLGLWRTAVARAAPGELAALGREGVAVATRAEVQAQARAALEAGQAVIATVGRRNHAIVFVQVEGQLYRLTGGALRSMAVRSMESFAPRSINAFHVLGGTEASARILAEAQMLARTWGPGIGFSFRSCGLSTARLAESGLLSLGSGGLGLAGGRAYLPVTVIGALAERGGVTMSQQGARWMLLGTGMQFGLLGTARSTVNVVTNPQTTLAVGGAVVDVFTWASDLLGPAAADLAPPQSSGGDAAPDPLAEMQVSSSDLDAALVATDPGDAGIALAAAPEAYLAVQNWVELASSAEANVSQPLTLEPHYTFLATADPVSAPPPVDLGAVVDLRAAVESTPGEDAHLDDDWIVQVSSRPEYAAAAFRFVDALHAAVDQQDHDRILDDVATYFDVPTPRPAERAAAAALALARAGLAGADLEGARSRLEQVSR